MPNYRYGGTSEIAFAVRRGQLLFHLVREDVREAFAQRPAGHAQGLLVFPWRGGPDIELVRDRCGPSPVRVPTGQVSATSRRAA